MNEKVEELFHQLADLTPQERGAYLAARNIDDETRRQVAALLAFDSADSGPLDRDISAAAANALSALDISGNRCGPFRLERVIGRGGMGVVYLASRDDGEVSQRAAIKLLRPGLSDAQKERFFSERQILAGLDHPNIARLLDAGRLPDGQPYLAMEFIDGKPIHEFAAPLPLRAKLQLFLKVCEATAYLHRNLVVHRDLKPSNILVTATGEPKLLDFGIAKILDDLADTTITGLRMLTPDYASPEQVLGERIGTASDIYSLGAVLYLLLTGHTPHDFADSSPGAVASAIVGKQITQPSIWLPALKGDLDVILSKALRKEPGERFKSVEELAGDLRAYLESRPISARHGEALYRTRKFVRRYWLPVSAATIAIAGLAAGLAIADRQRAIAQRRFDDVRQLSNKLFDVDLRVRDLQGSTQVRQFIVDTALAYLNRLVGDAHGDPALALDLGTAYMRVGRVQGVPISANLGQTENAETNLQLAEGLIASVLQAQPRNHMASLRMAQILHDRMVLAQARRPDTAALPLAERSREWWERYLDSGPVDTEERAQVSLIGINVANWLAQRDRLDAADRVLRRTIEVAQATGQTNYVGSANIGLTRMRRAAGDLDGALAASSDAVRLLEPVAGDKSRGRMQSYSLALESKGEVLGDTAGIGFGRNSDAAVFFAKCVKLAQAEALHDPSDASSRFRLSSCALHLGKSLMGSDPRQALAVFDDALSHSEEIKSNPRARRRETRLLAGSAAALRRLRRLPEARTRLETAFARLSELKTYPAHAIDPGSETYVLLRELAEWETANGNPKRAIAVYTELQQKLEKGGFAPDTELADAVDFASLLKAQASLHRSTSQPELATALDRRHQELKALWRQKKPGNLFVQKIWE